MWPSTCAAIGVISKLMDMEPSLSIGVIARDIICNCSWAVLVRLLEKHGTTDTSITTEDCDYRGKATCQRCLTKVAGR